MTNNQLKSFVERIERLEEEKAALAADIREVYGEAKSAGFDVKVMREVVRLRRVDSAARQEQEALLESYKEALGMLADTPLGAAAIEARTTAPVKRGRGRPPKAPPIQVAKIGDDYYRIETTKEPEEKPVDLTLPEHLRQPPPAPKGGDDEPAA